MSVLYLPVVVAVSIAVFNSVKCQADVRRNNSTAYSIQCPFSSQKRSILMSHDTDCERFYSCFNGIPHLQKCPPGLHFSSKLQVCDYPELAGCSNSAVSRETSLTRCPSSDSVLPAFIPHETDCDKFYICSRGIPNLKFCLSGLHFNPKVNVCDYPENAECPRDGKIPRGRKGMSPCPPGGNSNLTLLLPHPSDCNKFYMCARGVSYVRPCPTGLHFSRQKLTCDYPQDAQCSSVPTTRLRGTGVSNPLCPAIEGPGPVFLPHASNCSLYYMCSHGLAYEFECPARLHFNVQQKVCDYEELANCAAASNRRVTRSSRGRGEE